MVATTLAAGDLAILGFNFDNPDTFAFVLLTDVSVGTKINFTDKGWRNDGSFRDYEGIDSWTADTDKAAGTIVSVTSTNLRFATEGDQLIAYQGIETNPNFLYAINSEGSDWQSDATNSHTSALPTGLTEGINAIAFNEVDNAVYRGTTSGTKNELLAAIADPSNWLGSNNTRQILPDSFDSFSITNNSISIEQIESSNPAVDTRIASPFINEIHYDNISYDKNEGIEIAGLAGTDLAGWKLEFYNGNKGGKLYATFNLSGILNNQDNGFGTKFFAKPRIQNGFSDGIALIDNTGHVVQFLSYEGSLTALGGTADGLTSTDIGVSESNKFTPIGYSLQLTGNGSAYEDFTWAAAAASTYNKVNTNQSFTKSFTTSLNPDLTAIYEIQGSGMTSLYEGQTVTTQGIVVGDFQGSQQLEGFFIQDINGDGNTATSDGIFVYAPEGIDVAIGDLVEVSGTVIEYKGLTEITSVTDLNIVGFGNIIPTSISLPVASIATWEQYEGMSVKFDQTLTAIANYNLGQYGTVTLADDRLFQPTQIADPGIAANALKAQNDLRQIILDDGSITVNPEAIAGLTASDTLRTGDTVSGLTGVIDYSFGEYRIQPTIDPNFVAANSRTISPADVGGTLKVASFNVLNYFNGDGQGSGFPTSRGADSLSEFDRQRDKIIAAIADLDADIIGLMELENDGYGNNSAIQDLVKGLNIAQSENTYSFVDPGLSQLGGDEIAVGLIYRDTVRESGNAATISTGAFTHYNRQPLAQTFTDSLTGEEVTIVVNHFKSKSGQGTGLDGNLGDGQGSWNATRTNAAKDLTTWLATDPTGSNDPDFLIIGDLNAYALEDPIAAIKNAGYTNLLDRFNGNSAYYSYVFDGQAGTLDHALASSSLVDRVTGVTEWHINADEPRILDYNEEYKSLGQTQSLYDADPFRSSDHDPIIIGLDLSNI
ncbi:ExeM/NucH family extracellular endonuclease [Spirulina sp. 06S082]|uniref:ExeM/NucH family extracellular endonuclease n=1 Tax=Spirulina sp. 06S082 TaxID=3110248 RepID=UPI002B2216A4|nr:ExeM/NucH family extracellular endonuclease [Spirulina sp. 06S082]MEA5471001.1 ExeM/NucH family extracellular endonuclease [Spirulina sp. 06S082]